MYLLFFWWYKPDHNQGHFGKPAEVWRRDYEPCGPSLWVYINLQILQLNISTDTQKKFYGNNNCLVTGTERAINLRNNT